MSDRLLYISMLGDPDLYDPGAYTALCPSGLEREWIGDWHRPLAARHGFDLITLDICRGDALPGPETVAAVILGGTFHRADDMRPWLEEVAAWLTDYRRTGRPFLGICGGHQLVATRLEDGNLAERPEGTLIGTVPVDLTEVGRAHPLFRGLPDRPRLHFGNSQRVQPTSRQLGRTLATEVSHPTVAIDHGGNWFTCQFHPEARKPEFDCYFSSLDPAYESPYDDTHDGPQFLGNFLALAAQKRSPAGG